MSGGSGPSGRRGPVRALRSVVAVVRTPVVQRLFLVLALGLAVWAVWRDHEQVGAALSRLGAGTVAAAVAISAVHLVAAATSWWCVVRGLGARLGPHEGAEVFAIGQVARYVPGGVWQYLAVAEAGDRHRVPRRLTTGGSLLALLVSIAVGAALALAMSSTLGLTSFPSWVLAPVPLLALLPRVQDGLLGLLVRVARRDPFPQRLRAGAVLASAGAAGAAWVLLGGQVYLLAVGLGAPSGPRTFATCLAAFVTAWVAGLLVVVVPAGVGVREVVLAVLLGGLLDPGAVVLLVLVSRVLLTALEVLGAAAVLATRRPPAAPAPSSPPPG